MSSLCNNWLRSALGRRGALLGLLAILLGQFAQAAHELVVDHEEEEHCMVCHLSDRQDDAGELADTTDPLPRVAAVPAENPASFRASNAPLRVSARGPPRSL